MIQYDNVLYFESGADSLFENGSFQVINLIEAMRDYWPDNSEPPYPGCFPYAHNEFKQLYSDHHPISFKLAVRKDDD